MAFNDSVCIKDAPLITQGNEKIKEISQITKQKQLIHPRISIIAKHLGSGNITLTVLSPDDPGPDDGHDVPDPAPGVPPPALTHGATLHTQQPGGVIGPPHGGRLPSLQRDL